MAAPGKQTSRWGVGAFLQQAVAGVESRLDTILADDQEAGKAANAAAATPVAAPKPDTSTPRSANSNRTNERLQERLARAMAAKNAQKADSSMATPPRTDSPTQFTESLRQSFDMACTTVEREASTVSTEEVVESWPNQQSTPSNEVENSTIVSIPLSGSTQEPSSLTTQVESEDTACLSVDSARPSIPRDSMDSVRQPITSSRPFMEYPTTQISDVANHKAPEEYEELLKQLQSDFEISELQKHEEIHDYVERVDALQAKLQYLAKESADNAKTASNAAASGSLEKKVADKDEQIALLMEEGQKLSKKELSHLSAIKKLRSKIQENGKELAEAKLGQDKAEKDAAFANDRLKRAEGFERRVTEKERQINQLQKDLESARTERVSRDATIATLKRQLEDAAAENKKAEVKTAHESLVTERKKVADLEDNIANLKIEKSLIADRGQLQVKELRERIDKDAETARMLELEMRSEHQMLESKLEVMRARAEEVTTGATGDAQAKLLRQIETLQTQYAVASENWQGIEASLIARAASLEKERDEATKRETDIRRKAREVVSVNTLLVI
ncbi:TATA element modulatory factor 1 DNA binding-domain-containing protein [Calycina marina]|uniref:TATA element modulatory factor 1 DNA binding-domain-containing protein n=1 Tax=Calycina marina TaxID=1763456 RepID=A0A9P8CIT2_9HELO|nr:TATA element modulatory factor 1 DNA binding-domain-containing protein [Calycina marina]